MEIIALIEKSEEQLNKKLVKRYAYLQLLLKELRTKDISDPMVTNINQHIQVLNSFDGKLKELSKLVQKTIRKILNQLEKDLKIVPKNLFRARWMAIGMTVFGVPLGVSFGASMGNMGFIGIGIPIGMVIGMAIGAGMDKKAAKEGRQLQLEAMY